MKCLNKLHASVIKFKTFFIYFSYQHMQTKLVCKKCISMPIFQKSSNYLLTQVC